MNESTREPHLLPARMDGSAASPWLYGSFEPSACTWPAEPLTTGIDGDAIRLFRAGGLRLAFDTRRGACIFDVASGSLTLFTGAPQLAGVGEADREAIAEAIRARLAQGTEGRLPALGGRYALAHIDLRARRLWLATDRFGVHPLCLRALDGSIEFADRADALARDPAAQIDLQAIYDYVYFHVIPAPRTIFRGVERLQAAQVASFGPDGLHRQAAWQPRFDGSERAASAPLGERFRQTIEGAVRRAAGSGRTGSFLSGGTDSSTVAAFLSRVAGGPVPTFSIGFDAQGYDEMAYARIAARAYGTEHHEYYLQPEDLVRGIPEVAAHYDQPFGNSSALPAFYCARLAREHGVERLLAGDGGDELFGGNTRYAKQKVFQAYHALPAALRARLLEPMLLGLPGLRRMPGVSKAVSYVEQARVELPDRLETYNLLERFGPDALFRPALLAGVDRGAPLALQRAAWRGADADAVVDRMLAYDWRFTLADCDLPKVTGTTRLAGVEAGFPLLDDALVDLSLQLAPSLKVRGLALRYFFKEALRGVLPDEIIRKRKHGFGLPFGPWLQRSAPLRELATRSLEALAERGVVRAECVRDLLSERLAEHAGYYGEMVWVLMMLEQWLGARAPAFALR